MSSVVNIAAYKFVALSGVSALRAELKALCDARALKGTILLSDEGINLFLAGARADIDTLLDRLRAHPALADLRCKESYSRTVPFKRMLVKIKREIIPGGAGATAQVPNALPLPTPRVSAAELKRWLDEGRCVTLLDTRNAFEIEHGSFTGAQQLQLSSFREFERKAADYAAALDVDARAQPIVTFCTGGIRCEKAAPMLMAQGLREVYQLDGGILEYFKQCGPAHYDGNCFVFDERIALTPQLEEAPAS